MRTGWLVTTFVVVTCALTNAGTPQGPKAGEKIYTSPNATFRFNYPASFDLYAGKDAASPAAQMSYLPVCEKQDAIVCVFFPQEIYGGTNYGDAAFSVNLLNATDTSKETDCLSFLDYRDQQLAIRIQKTPKIIGNAAFSAAVRGSVGLGHVAEDHLYRSFHQGRCYELKISVTQTVYENYPEDTIRRFTPQDMQRVQRALTQVLESFRFLK